MPLSFNNHLETAHSHALGVKGHVLGHLLLRHRLHHALVYRIAVRF